MCHYEEFIIAVCRFKCLSVNSCLICDVSGGHECCTVSNFEAFLGNFVFENGL